MDDRVNGHLSQDKVVRATLDMRYEATGSHHRTSKGKTSKSCWNATRLFIHPVSNFLMQNRIGILCTVGPYDEHSNPSVM